MPRLRFRLVARSRLRPLVSLILVAATAVAGCARDRTPEGPLVVYNAGSLARPIRAALDSFAARERVTYEQESAGSLETARKLTELGKIPDIVALADADVFPGYLVPSHLDSWTEFARNRMVLAYTDKSRFASEMNGEDWWRVLLRPGVETGRSDPQLDPNGYRTLLVWQLAERHYHEGGLATRLAQASPERNVRPKEADLVGLLQAGEFDYIWSYESMAKSIGLRYVILPSAVDLATPDSAAAYATAHVTVRGAGTSDSVTFTGKPIVYAFGIPRAAPHAALALRFAEYLRSEAGRAVLRSQGLDALDAPTDHTKAP